ncbi:MAG TPA: metallophosphoesterase [Candidatus Nitrosotenuis sp.]|nr:metallophosphoesterase [Candidatus Nitrosotenuis sp.]
MATTRIVPSKPALILEGEERHLIITDLHIGFEDSLAQNKIFVGKNTALKEFIEEVNIMIDEHKPNNLILLGDIKAGINRILKNEWSEVPQFLQELKNKIDVIIIPGNHDANIQRLIPDGVNLISSAGLVLENTLLTHGHTMPTENFAHVDRIIMGHVHPVFFDEDSILNGQQVWISIKTDKGSIFPSSKGEIEITIIPSFNKYFYATKKRQYKRSISPIIEKIKNVSSARIVTLDGVIIGNEVLLHQVI